MFVRVQILARPPDRPHDVMDLSWKKVLAPRFVYRVIASSSRDAHVRVRLVAGILDLASSARPL